MTENPRLRPKYMVAKVGKDGEMFGPGMKSTDPEDVDSPFVLMPRKDPAAFFAMYAYMNTCEPQLACEIRDWLTKIVLSEPIFGTQGSRNRIALRLRMLSEA